MGGARVCKSALVVRAAGNIGPDRNRFLPGRSQHQRRGNLRLFIQAPGLAVEAGALKPKRSRKPGNQEEVSGGMEFTSSDEPLRAFRVVAFRLLNKSAFIKTVAEHRRLGALENH